MRLQGLVVRRVGKSVAGRADLALTEEHRDMAVGTTTARVIVDAGSASGGGFVGGARVGAAGPVGRQGHRREADHALRAQPAADATVPVAAP